MRFAIACLFTKGIDGICVFLPLSFALPFSRIRLTAGKKWSIRAISIGEVRRK